MKRYTAVKRNFGQNNCHNAPGVRCEIEKCYFFFCFASNFVMCVCVCEITIERAHGKYQEIHVFRFFRFIRLYSCCALDFRVCLCVGRLLASCSLSRSIGRSSIVIYPLKQYYLVLGFMFALYHFICCIASSSSSSYLMFFRLQLFIYCDMFCWFFFHFFLPSISIQLWFFFSVASLLRPVQLILHRWQGINQKDNYKTLAHTEPNTDSNNNTNTRATTKSIWFRLRWMTIQWRHKLFNTPFLTLFD